MDRKVREIDIPVENYGEMLFAIAEYLKPKRVMGLEGVSETDLAKIALAFQFVKQKDKVFRSMVEDWNPMQLIREMY